MPGVEITGPRLVATPSGTRISVDISIDGVEREWWIETTSTQVSSLLDPFLAGAIVPAMKLGQPVVLHGPVSQAYLDQVPVIQRIHEVWREDAYHPTLKRFSLVDVIADDVVAAPQVGSRTLAYFSGGVDSFYTVLRQLDDVDAVLYADDFEMPFPPDVREQVYGNAQAAADAMGTPLVRVSTNYKELFLPFVTWKMTSGFLPTLGVLHAPEFGRVLAGAASDLSSLKPWGTHPLLDWRYGAGGQEIVHDGWDTTRLEKVAFLAEQSVAMRHLRVCWQPAVNCGRCSKCVRTRLALEVLDRADRAVSFPPEPLTPELVERWVRDAEDGMTYYEEIAYFLATTGRHPEWAEVIERGREPLPRTITRDEAVAALAPERVRRMVRWARARRAGRAGSTE